MLPCICPVIFRSQMTSKCGKNKKVAHEAIVSGSTIILRRRKVEFIKWINLVNVLFIRFVKFEIMQWFTVYQDQFCVWLSLARLPTAGVFFFASHFLKKETALSFFFLLDFPSRTCSMPQRYILGLSFPNHVKYYLISQNFLPF